MRRIGNSAVLSGHGDQVHSAAYSPTAPASSPHRETARYASGMPAPVFRLPCSQLIGSTFESRNIRPDDSHIVSVSEDATVRIWDAHSGVPLAAFSGHDVLPVAATFSPDGTRSRSLLWTRLGEFGTRARARNLPCFGGMGIPCNSWLIHPMGHALLPPHAIRPRAFGMREPARRSRYSRDIVGWSCGFVIRGMALKSSPRRRIKPREPGTRAPAHPLSCSLATAIVSMLPLFSGRQPHRYRVRR